MIKYLLQLIVGLLLYATINAQTGKKITGIIKDTTGNLLQNVTVSLYAFNIKRDTLKQVSKADGSFTFLNVEADEFKIEMSAVGYALFSKIFRYPEAKDLRASLITRFFVTNSLSDNF